MPARLLAALLAAAAFLSAETALFPLSEIRPGLRGTGRTVFTGNRIEEFPVEILGVLENIGPKQNLILARLSGKFVEHAGVLQGMSGSPVYVNGRLVGAVAMAFTFSKDPIAGIRPIEEMLAVGKFAAPLKTQRAAISLFETDLTRGLPRREEISTGGMRMTDVATPVSFSGFTSRTVDAFGPQLRALGLEPRQGVSGGGSGKAIAAAGPLEPGSMISVQLMSGDMAIGADGTVTHIDGGRIYGFGHRFLAIGPAELPFARAEVLTLLPSYMTSFKISTAREPVGVITQDRNTGIYGQIGKRATLVPVRLRVKSPEGQTASYRMEMVHERFLSPLLTQMAVFSAIDSTERGSGVASFALRGAIELSSGAKIRLNNMYAADAGAAMPASMAAAIPMAYILQAGFENLSVRGVDLEIESFLEKKQLQIDQFYVAQREARPGENIELVLSLTGENGAEQTRKLQYKLPSGAPAGPLYFTVSDGNITNFLELRNVVLTSPRSVDHLLSIVNSLRPNHRAYVRVWRADPNFSVQGADLPAPPPSAALLLAETQSAQAALTQMRNAKIAEIEIDLGNAVISGSKTAQIDVRE